MDSRQERVMVFIDGSNMYHSLKAFSNRTDIDLGKFCNKLLEKRRLIRGTQGRAGTLYPSAAIFR
jgi:hypothetical protein